MSKTKHTPGPWKVSPTDDTVVIDATGAEVAAIDGDYNAPDTWPKMEANARLIAAAPDLLEAGKPFAAIADAFERKMHDAGFTTRDSDEVGPDWFCGFTFGDLRALRAAIASAEGRS